MNIAMFVFCGFVSFSFGLAVGRFINPFKRVDGLFIVDDNDTTTTRWILDVKIDPETIPNKKEIRLKVRKMSED